MNARRVGAIVCAVMSALSGLSCSEDATDASFVSLRFSHQPSDIIAGEPVDITVEVVDAGGARVSVSDDIIIATGAAGSDEKTFEIRGGVATIDDYIVTKASDDQVLVASARGLSVVSLPFRVAPAAADGRMSTVAPATESLLSNTAREVVFTFADKFGNTLPRADVRVNSDVSDATFIPAGGKTGLDGTFRTKFRPPSAGTAHFVATVAGATIAIGESLAIADACAPAPVVVPGLITSELILGQGCLVSGTSFQFYQFTTAAATGVALNFRPTFLMYAEMRANAAEADVPLVIGDTSVIRQFILPAGTYQLRIAAFADGGPYSMTSTLTPANRGDTIRVIVAPGTYTGQTLGPGDFLNSVDSYTDAYAIFSARPCTITARSTDFDVYLSLTNSFGLAIGSDDNSAGGTDAQITRANCTSSGGTIRVDVASVLPGKTGAHTLTIAYN